MSLTHNRLNGRKKLEDLTQICLYVSPSMMEKLLKKPKKSKKERERIFKYCNSVTNAGVELRLDYRRRREMKLCQSF